MWHIPPDIYDFMTFHILELWNRAVAALVAADDVAVPATASADGSSGTLGVIETAAKVRRLLGDSRERALEVAGVVVVDWLRTNEAQLRKMCEGCEVRVFETRVRHTVRMGVAQGSCESVLVADPSATASGDYRALAEEYLALPGRDFRGGREISRHHDVLVS